MQISSILDIIDGKLLNTPSISFIYSIKATASKVKEGDLFIAKNQDEIELAVKNGAFAILSETNHPIIDNEIAWIKVKNIDLAIIKLIRFKLSTKHLKAYFCQKATYDILKIYSNNLEENIKLVPKNIENFLKHLENIEENAIIISSNKTILDKIYPQNSSFDDTIFIKSIENLIEHSLFESSFSHKDIYFSRIKISSLYIPNFLKAYEFLSCNLDFSKLKSFHNLKAIFLDKNLNLIEFGKSDRFIICQNNENLYNNEIFYIKEKYKYAKTIFISSFYIDILSKDEQTIIEDLEELKPILKNLEFNAVYLVGFNHKQVINYFLKSQKFKTLF